MFELVYLWGGLVLLVAGVFAALVSLLRRPAPPRLTALVLALAGAVVVSLIFGDFLPRQVQVTAFILLLVLCALCFFRLSFLAWPRRRWLAVLLVVLSVGYMVTGFAAAELVEPSEGLFPNLGFVLGAYLAGIPMTVGALLGAVWAAIRARRQVKAPHV